MKERKEREKKKNERSSPNTVATKETLVEKRLDLVVGLAVVIISHFIFVRRHIRMTQFLTIVNGLFYWTYLYFSFSSCSTTIGIL